MLFHKNTEFQEFYLLLRVLQNRIAVAYFGIKSNLRFFNVASASLPSVK
jgi:hypothetical protein